MKFSLSTFDRDRHSRFLFKAVKMRATEFPYVLPGRNLLATEDLLAETVRRVTVSNPRGAIVAHSQNDPDLFYGVVVSLFADPVECVFLHVKDVSSGFGVMTELCQAAGIDPSRPTPVWVWSETASNLAAQGYRIYHAPSIERRVRQKEK